MTKVQGETLHILIQVTNRGNAAAHQVRAEADVLGERFGSRVQTGLGPNETTEFNFNKPLHQSLKGTFPLRVLVHFQDSNGYPFSALTCTTFIMREKGDATISVTSVPLNMKDDGVVRFRVQNTGTDPRQAKATLQFPNEFSCDKPSLYFTLTAGEEKSLSFPIRNLSALYGAGYPVFMVLEHQGAGMHSSSVAGVLVKIVNDGNWFRKTRWHWAGGAVLIGFLWASSMIVKRNLVDDFN